MYKICISGNKCYRWGCVNIRSSFILLRATKQKAEVPFTDQKATLSVVVCRYRRCCELLAFSSFPDLLDKFLAKGVGVEISIFFNWGSRLFFRKTRYSFIENIEVQKTCILFCQKCKSCAEDSAASIYSNLDFGKWYEATIGALNVFCYSVLTWNFFFEILFLKIIRPEKQKLVENHPQVV